MSTPANILTANLLVEIPKRYPTIRVWRNNRIDAMLPGAGGKMRRVQAGIDGQADITGIVKIEPYHIHSDLGLRLEIEVKAPGDRQSEKQKAFQKMIEDHAGIYIVARSVEQCLEDLGRWV